MKKPAITVVGSLNMDLVTLTDRFPEQGETVLGKEFFTVPGGKGANQAVAASRLGAEVKLVGRIGNDPFGEVLKETMEKNGVFLTDVKPVTDVASGVATIILSESDNRIIVTPGANNFVTKEYVESYKEVILSSDMVLLQMEIPLATIIYVVELCHANNVPVILNPAPAQKLDEGIWHKVTYLTPNETEKEVLFGNNLNQALREKLIITEGKRGATYFKSDKSYRIKGFPVQPVDTTGAGDTFNGALAVAFAEGQDLKKAVTFANAAAAISVLKRGAQGGMPNRPELDHFLNEREIL
ncbi:ribokinase [Salipaludibacillus aurantiacus]|uniref:Ribokinase n=1 Tax=Salipaludibacillus aurantiacus TaxID=1601833 RepID=A0A1H9U8M6_9BACI|nr:ribokinase [Salipaludibacillus aurantiacus]SES05699.1 ribokinase [Salipaludibacillus aurantiacus]